MTMTMNIENYRRISCGCCTGVAGTLTVQGDPCSYTIRQDQCVCSIHQDMHRHGPARRCSQHDEHNEKEV